MVTALAVVLLGGDGMGGIGDASAQSASNPVQVNEPPDKKPNAPGQYRKHCKKPQSYEEAGLCQQWRIAETTERIRALTVRQVSNSRWQIGLLVAIFAATAIAAIAAASAARAALNSVRPTRQIGETELGPETVVSEPEVRPSELV